MAEGYLRPNGVSTRDLSTRRQEDGQFRNPPTYTNWGGFENAARGKWDRNKMTLERGGPKAVQGRPMNIQIHSQQFSPPPSLLKMSPERRAEIDDALDELEEIVEAARRGRRMVRRHGRRTFPRPMRRR